MSDLQTYVQWLLRTLSDASASAPWICRSRSADCRNCSSVVMETDLNRLVAFLQAAGVCFELKETEKDDLGRVTTEVEVNDFPEPGRRSSYWTFFAGRLVRAYHSYEV